MQYFVSFVKSSRCVASLVRKWEGNKKMKALPLGPLE
jgi:hypothetical protein